jgi:DNA-binding beta-propeller fold protein YncE
VPIDGGLNENQRAPGNGDVGIDLSFGEIAIDPSGSYLLTKGEGGIHRADLHTAEVTHVAPLDNAIRVAFSPDGRTVYAATWDGDVVRYDLGSSKVAWKRPVFAEQWVRFGDGFGEKAFPWIDVTPDGLHVVVTSADGVEVLDASGEQVLREKPVATVVDVDVHQEGTLIITTEHTWTDRVPEAPVLIVSVDGKLRSEVKVPNCADELIVTRNGKYALMGPTTCVPPESSEAHDPVSVIDLETGTFVRNLPGFGPVALSPQGDLAVAFVDADNLDRTLFEKGQPIPTSEETRYHLMFIDTRDLSFETMPLGDDLPRYTLTPDGKLLLVDSTFFSDTGRLRVIDPITRSAELVNGPDVRLDNYVVTQDSTRIFMLDRGLYELTLQERLVSSIAIPFSPRALNITPDDSRLLLREDDSTLWVFDTAAREMSTAIHFENGVEAEGEYDAESKIEVDVDVGSAPRTW